jgi:isohexenylglutaconyl-CoA hydratase
MSALPQTEQIKLERNGPVLHLWLNRPEARNAMSRHMQGEILATFNAIRDDRSVRVVVIRGAGGTFCAGGDIKNMQKSGSPPPADTTDDLRAGNRRGGAMLQAINTAPQAVISVIEGYALGGGFGLSCVSDISIVRTDATLGLTEVTIGVVPAAISPFVVGRIGLTAARRLGVSGMRISGSQAVEIGLAHVAVADVAALEAALKTAINQVLKCAPGAVAETKRLMLRAAGVLEIDNLQELAADSFVRAVRGAEGREGTLSFVEKRKPNWVTSID